MLSLCTCWLSSKFSSQTSQWIDDRWFNPSALGMNHCILDYEGFVNLNKKRLESWFNFLERICSEWINQFWPSGKVSILSCFSGSKNHFIHGYIVTVAGYDANIRQCEMDVISLGLWNILGKFTNFWRSLQEHDVEYTKVNHWIYWSTSENEVVLMFMIMWSWIISTLSIISIKNDVMFSDTIECWLQFNENVL